MTVFFKLLMVLTSAVSLLAAAPEDRAVSDAERASIQAAVLEVHAGMTKAGQDVDADRLFSFILDNDKGSIIQNGVLLLTREQALAEVSGSFRGVRSVEYRWKQKYVTVLSPTVALLVAEGDASATTEQGGSFTSPMAQTAVFVLNGGKWKVLHAHYSSPARR
jgi:hypothetical protein